MSGVLAQSVVPGGIHFAAKKVKRFSPPCARL